MATYLELLIGALEELQLLRVFLFLHLPPLCLPLLDGLTLGLLLIHLTLKVPLLHLKACDLHRTTTLSQT